MKLNNKILGEVLKGKLIVVEPKRDESLKLILEKRLNQEELTDLAKIARATENSPTEDTPAFKRKIEEIADKVVVDAKKMTESYAILQVKAKFDANAELNPPRVSLVLELEVEKF